MTEIQHAITESDGSFEGFLNLAREKVHTSD